MSSLPLSTHRHVQSLLQNLALLPTSDTADRASPEAQSTNADSAKRLVLSTLKKLRVAGAGGGLRKEWEDVEQEVKAIITKAQILVQDDIAKVLEVELGKLVQLRKKEAANPIYDRDAEIKAENFPAHLTFLLSLSNPPDAQTHGHASAALDSFSFRPQTDRDLWNEIFSSVNKPSPGRQEVEDDDDGWEEPDWGSHASAISWDDSFDDERSTLSDSSSHPKSLRSRTDLSTSSQQPSSALSLQQSKDQHALDLELHATRHHLKSYLSRAYWEGAAEGRSDIRQGEADGEILTDIRGWEKVSGVRGLGRLLDRVGSEERQSEGFILPDLRINIREVDAVREVLFALTGRPGALFSFTAQDGCLLNPYLRLPHLSPDLSLSLLQAFASHSSTLQTTSAFIAQVFRLSRASLPNSRPDQNQRSWRCKTLEAFSSSLSRLVHAFHTFCSTLEQSLLPRSSATTASLTSSQPVTTLLQLSNVIEPHLRTLNFLHSLLPSISSPPLTSRRPAELANTILDALTRSIDSHRMMDDHQTADELERVFVESAEPMWEMTGRWLSNGMVLADEVGRGGMDGLEEEFFICRASEVVEEEDASENERERSSSPSGGERASEEEDDFWRKGYRLREEGPPAFLGEETAEGILAAGKAVGLLRVLGLPVEMDDDDGGLDEDEGDACSESNISLQERGGARRWLSLRELVFGIRDESLDTLPLVQISSDSILLPPPLPLPIDPPSSSSTHRSQTPSIFSPLPPEAFSISTSPFSLPHPSLPLTIGLHLAPLLCLFQYRLASTLRRSSAGCSLAFHLSAIEGLFFMRRGGTMREWCEELMRKMDESVDLATPLMRRRRGRTSSSWLDGHMLNASFRDAVSCSEGDEDSGWIDPLLVKFWAEGGGRSSQARSSSGRSVRVLEAIVLSYQVPFPLIYLFTPQTFLVRSSIFTFLLQIRRAKHSLEKLTLLSKLSANRPNGFSRDPVVTRTDDGGGGGEQKRFWALRRRLMWVVNELFNFFMVYVLELETEKFKEALEGTASLDEMIPLHEEHISRLKSLCLLNDKSTSLSRTIISILDLSLSFSSLFQSYLTSSSTTNLLSSNTSRSFSQHQSLSLSRSSRSFLHPFNSTTSHFPSSSLRRTRSFRSKKLRGAEYEEELGDEDFFEGVQEAEDDDDEGGGLAGEGGSETGSRSVLGGSISSVSFGTSLGGDEVDAEWLRRLEKMQAELNSLVSFFRLGVDMLSKTIAPASVVDSRAAVFGDIKETWAVLSFQLESWQA